MAKTIRISNPHDKKLYEKVSAIAKTEHRSVPEQAEHMISYYIDQIKNKRP
jgi:hypothetical protein